MFFLQFDNEPNFVIKIIVCFDYDKILALFSVEKRIFYCNFLLFIKYVVIKEFAFFVKFVDFIRTDTKIYNNIDVLFMIKNYFFNTHMLYQSSINVINKKQATLNIIKKKH